MIPKFDAMVHEICKTFGINEGGNLESQEEITRIFNEAITKIQNDTSKNLSLTRQASKVLKSHERDLVFLSLRPGGDSLNLFIGALGEKIGSHDRLHILDELQKNPKLFETKSPSITESSIDLVDTGASPNQKLEFFRYCVSTWRDTQDEDIQEKLENLMNVMREELSLENRYRREIYQGLQSMISTSWMNKEAPLKLLAQDSSGVVHTIPLKLKHVFLSPFLKSCLPSEAEGDDAEIIMPYSFEKVRGYLDFVEGGEQSDDPNTLLRMREVAKHLQDDLHLKLLTEDYQNAWVGGTANCIEQVANVVGTANNDLEPVVMNHFRQSVYLKSADELLKGFEQLHSALGEMAASIQIMNLKESKVDAKSLIKIAELFPNIKKLYLNYVKTLEVFPKVTWNNLEEIDAYNSSLSDISALAELPKLSVATFLRCSRLANVDSLKGKEMKSLDIKGTLIGKEIEGRYYGRGNWRGEFPLLKSLKYTDQFTLDDLD